MLGRRESNPEPRQRQTPIDHRQAEAERREQLEERALHSVSP